MTRARVFPHRRIGHDVVSWGGWMASLHGNRPFPLEDRLQSWDYSTRVGFGLAIEVADPEAVQSTSGCPVDDLELVVLVDCPSTGVRHHTTAKIREVTGGPPVMVDLPAGVLADTVKLSAHVVVGVNSSGTDGRATRPGSRLAESGTRTVVLEGDLHRFPTEAVSFSALRLEHAAWSLRVRFGSLEDSFVGSVRLLVNTDHPAASVLMDLGDPDAPALHSFLRLDVARQLILTVAMDRGLDLDETSGSREDEGSVRAGLEALCQTFLSMDLAAAVQLARQDPERFERLMQSGVEFLRDLVE